MSEIKFTTDGSGPRQVGDGKKYGHIIALVVVILAIAVVLFNSLTIVNEGFIGVKYRFGKITGANLQAGLNFHIPFIEEIQQVDIRNRIYEVEEEAYTSDTQTVNQLRMKLNYKLDQGQLPTIIREIGVDNVEGRFLVPNVKKIAKNEIGKVKAEVLVQSRDQVQQAIQDELAEALAPHGIIVIDFALENLNFDSAFEASIQAKVIAAQDALKMENKTREREEEAKQVVIAAQAEADSVKISAEAEAEAIALIQEQLASSPSYIDYLKIINWNGILPQVIGDGVNPFVVLDSNNVDETPSYTAPQTVTQTETP